jgi:glyoxylase-like metal-dependent hydrolase (beta-lactamase superfamily II)
LPGFDTASYAVKPYAEKIVGFLADGDTLQLGNRLLEVMRVPGHTPDCIALLDRANGYLWTGDMYYEATIWLFFDGTDLEAYRKNIGRFAALAPILKRVFPAHNTPVADPANLLALQKAFDQVMDGTAAALPNPDVMHPEDSLAVTFEFEKFSFRIRSDVLYKMK